MSEQSPPRRGRAALVLGIALLGLILVGGGGVGLYLNRDRLAGLLPGRSPQEGAPADPREASASAAPASRPFVASAPIHAGEYDYAHYLQRRDVLVLVDYYADWCGPCRGIAPHLERLASEHGDSVVVLKVNVDQQKDLARRAGVQGIPDIRLVHHGEELERVVGGRPYDFLESMVLRHRSRLPAPGTAPGDATPTAPAATGPAIQPMIKGWLPPGVERKGRT